MSERVSYPIHTDSKTALEWRDGHTAALRAERDALKAENEKLKFHAAVLRCSRCNATPHVTIAWCAKHEAEHAALSNTQGDRP